MTDNGNSMVLDAFAWIKDAPLFIDDANLDRFYDAVVRPTFKEVGPRTIKISDEQKKELQASLKATAKTQLPSWLSSLLTAGIEVAGEGVRKGAETASSSEEISLEAISTPQRQLEQLAAFYLLRYTSRLFLGGIDAPLGWQRDGVAVAVPRALAFLDLPPGTQLIPMSAEFTNGKVVTFYDKMRAGSGEYPPPFDEAKREEYWAWYAKHFDARRSVKLIEEAAAVQGARIEWIDHRVPLDLLVNTMHLHVAAAGRYNTGTFAYRLISRCAGHGMRIVGTLKDGPDLNVLAIYER